MKHVNIRIAGPEKMVCYEAARIPYLKDVLHVPN